MKIDPVLLTVEHCSSWALVQIKLNVAFQNWIFHRKMCHFSRKSDTFVYFQKREDWRFNFRVSPLNEFPLQLRYNLYASILYLYMYSGIYRYKKVYIITSSYGFPCLKCKKRKYFSLRKKNFERDNVRQKIYRPLITFINPVKFKYIQL